MASVGSLHGHEVGHGQGELCPEGAALVSEDGSGQAGCTQVRSFTIFALEFAGRYMNSCEKSMVLYPGGKNAV